MAVPEGALELSVGITSRRRKRLWSGVVYIALFAPAMLIGLTLIILSGASPDPWILTAGVFLLCLAFPTLVMLPLDQLRFRVWLHDTTVYAQGWLRLRSIPLAHATLEYSDRPWSYIARLGPAKLRRVSYPLHTLVIRRPGTRKIAIPLLRRDKLSPSAVHWLPAPELSALADAVEAAATAPNRELVARFLRAAASGRPLIRTRVTLEPVRWLG